MNRRLFFADAARDQPFHAYLRRADFAFPLHCHDFWEAFLCLEGRGLHEINGQSHPLSPGDCWLVRPDDVHHVRPLHDFAFINVSWPVENWEKWRAVAALENEPLHGHANAPHLEALFRAMLRPLFEAAKPLELCRFWAEIASVMDRRTFSDTRPEWMLGALRAVETEDGLRAGWPLLLQSAHVSPGHLCREWKKAFGVTPTQWINARRLEKAAALLVQSNLPVKDISARCGFDNTTYFYRLFGAKYAKAPHSYRKKSRQNESAFSQKTAPDSASETTSKT